MKEWALTQALLKLGSPSVNDMIIPGDKPKVVEKARQEIDKVEEQYRQGIITTGERYNKVIDIWTNATDEISDAVFKGLLRNDDKEEVNPVYLMMDSRVLRPAANRMSTAWSARSYG